MIIILVCTRDFKKGEQERESVREREIERER